MAIVTNGDWTAVGGSSMCCASSREPAPVGLIPPNIVRTPADEPTPEQIEAICLVWADVAA
ncbi:hypothetical protein Pmi06nite_77760 [Planotetraspora mira]|uniref:Uncharacterized protein n=1 Tax=Planotetraspora mira TaxID=58121 RepID=A0A8J3U1I8_9ACTN|nr:hypothetical protein Pmi06nite_77760 [Planotetraspora mira]